MGLRRLAWDAPNVDMQIANIVGARPTPSQRPDFGALGRWFVGQSPDANNEAAVFANVPEVQPERLLQWLTVLVSVGFRVFAKPKVGDSDIDDDMAAYLEADPPEGMVLDEVVAASHDAAAFQGVLERVAARGVRATVLAFGEYAGGLRHAEALVFQDLGDVPGLFAAPLPRMDLGSLPAEGRWFEPRARLGTLSSRGAAIVPAIPTGG